MLQLSKNLYWPRQALGFDAKIILVPSILFSNVVPQPQILEPINVALEIATRISKDDGNDL